MRFISHVAFLIYRNALSCFPFPARLLLRFAWRSLASSCAFDCLAFARLDIGQKKTPAVWRAFGIAFGLRLLAFGRVGRDNERIVQEIYFAGDGFKTQSNNRSWLI